MVEASVTPLRKGGNPPPPAPPSGGCMMPLYSGGQLSFDSVTEDDIRPIDIIEALSKANRYRGHTYFPYTVAQHSCCVADLVAEVDDSPEAMLYALLHDAAEAYMTDIPEPYKRRLKEKGVWYVFEDDEAAFDRAILTKFGLEYPVPEKYSKLVREADIRMVATELEDVMPPVPPGQWWNLDSTVARADFEISPMTYDEVRQMFASAINANWNRLHKTTRKKSRGNVRPLK